MADLFCTPESIDTYFEPVPSLPVNFATGEEPPALVTENLLKEILNVEVNKITPAQVGVGTPPLEGIDAFNAEVNKNLIAINQGIAQVTTTAVGALTRLNAINSFSTFLSERAKDQKQTTIEELNQIINLMQTFGNLATIDIPGVKEFGVGLGLINNEYVQPLIRWSQKMGTLFGSGSSISRYIGENGTINIDLTNRDGSLQLLSQLTSEALDGLGKFTGPWGANLNALASWVRAGTQIYQNVVNAVQGAAAAVQAAGQLLKAAHALAIAACEALPAIKMMANNLFSNIIAYGLALFNQGLQPPFILKNLTFNFPELPTFDLLATYKGISGVLVEGWEQFTKACNPLFTGTPTKPNMNALSDGITSIQNGQQAIQNGTAGIGQITNGLSNSQNTYRATFEQTNSMIELAPQRTGADAGVISVLSNMFGASTKWGETTNAPPPGASSQACDAMPGFNGVDEDGNPQSDTPIAPSPEKTQNNLANITSDLSSIVNNAAMLGNYMMSVGNLGLQLGPGATEAQGKAALKSFVKTSTAVSLGKNAVMSDLNDITSLNQAAMDYFYCQRLAAFEGAELLPSSPVEMLVDANRLYAQSEGLPNSALSWAQTHRKLNPSTGKPTAAEEFTANPETLGVPSNWYQSGYESILTSAKNPDLNPIDYDNIPLQVICKNDADFQKLTTLLSILSVVDSIISNTKLYNAHMGVLLKANQQGVFSNSPYVWLGRLSQLFAGFIENHTAENNVQAMTEILHEFFNHSRRDIRSLVSWLGDALESIDEDAPIPIGLDGDISMVDTEAYAAQQSFNYVNSLGNPELGDFIIYLRQNTDFLGGPLAFDYAYQIAIALITTRAANYLDKPLANTADTKYLLNIAMRYASKMKQGKAQAEVLTKMIKALE